MGKKVYLKTYGCQMNESDSEIIRAILRKKGYEFIDRAEEADVILFNTCTVRDLADRKVYGKLGMLGKLKHNNPNIVFGVLGCMAESSGEKVRKNQPHVDLVVGPKDILKIPDLLEDVVKKKAHHVAIDGDQRVFSFDQIRDRQDNVRAWVTIMRGCNKMCSFCIVPYVRGSEVSREMPDILSEIEALAERKYKEVTLLGQNVNSYGKDLKEKVSFSDLLHQVNDIKGIERIRFVTSHPMDVRDSLIDGLQLNKICENIHFPVQSGSNHILKLMRRNYTTERYLEIVLKLRSTVPDITISTDVIVGFPGETDEDFRHTCDLFDEVKFDQAFIFKYSARKNTIAATLPDQISDKVKEQRHKVLSDIYNQYCVENLKKEIGSKVEVLVEGVSKNRNDWLTGRTRRNHIVVFPGNNDLKGKLLDINILSSTAFTLYGEIANGQL